MSTKMTDADWELALEVFGVALHERTVGKHLAALWLRRRRG